jgi:hypothetical protein
MNSLFNFTKKWPKGKIKFGVKIEIAFSLKKF